jgi:hypothetical protein
MRFAKTEPIMTDNLFSAVLTFSLLIAGTAAIGSEMLNTRPAGATAKAVVTLPPVSIVAHRQAASEFVMLPRVTITGHREAATRVATDNAASESRSVE